MGNNAIATKSVSNMVWRFCERFAAQIVGFVVSIVLARKLDTTDYGIIALVTVVTNILNVFIDSGMGSALVQKKDSDDLDFSSVFYFNVVMCLTLYIGLFFASPFIAGFYEMPELTSVIRVLGITLLISGVKGIQNAYVAKHLIFKKFFFATLIGTVLAAIVGIAMAYMGFGVWALVAQHLTNTAVDTIVLWFTVKWRPKKQFSFDRVKTLFSYGWKLLVSSLLNTVFLDLRQLIIGKKYSKDDLSFYNRGDMIPKLVVSNISSSIDSVLLPVMSSLQDDSEAVKKATRRSIKTSSFFLWPMMLGLTAVAEPLVLLLLGEKWLPCVPYMQIFCLVKTFEPIHSANLNAIKAMGRSDLFLKMEIIKKTIAIGLVLCAINLGVTAIALSSLVYSIIASVMNARPNKKLLNYSYWEQVKDIMPYALLSGVMFLVVWIIKIPGCPTIMLLILKVIVGMSVYLGMAYLLKLESMVYVITFAKNILSKRKSKHGN